MEKCEHKKCLDSIQTTRFIYHHTQLVNMTNVSPTIKGRERDEIKIDEFVRNLQLLTLS